jgi:hypothetical protein
MQKGDYDFWTILRSIPLVNVHSAKESMALPELAPTRQLASSEFLARLKCINFIFRASTRNGLMLSGKDVNYLTKKIVQYSQDGVFRTIADKDIYRETITTVKEIVEKSNSAQYKIE